METDMEARLKPPSAAGAQQGSSLFTHFEDVQVNVMQPGPLPNDVPGGPK